MRRSFGLLAAFTLLLGAACAPAAAPAVPTAAIPPTPATTGEVVVFAASSLTDAFNDLSQRFQAANPGVKVTLSYGASTALRTQLEQGARADVFASANQAEMDKAKASGVIGGADRTFAKNRLAVIVPKTNPGKVADLKDLARPGLKLVTAAPEVPVGVYTQDMLDKLAKDPGFSAEFKERVNANIVSREANVRQVVAKVGLGEADAAVVYSTDVTPDIAANITSLPIADQFNTLASYPLAVTKPTANPTTAEAFVAYVMGAEGQDVLRKWGFLSPN